MNSAQPSVIFHVSLRDVPHGRNIAQTLNQSFVHKESERMRKLFGKSLVLGLVAGTALSMAAMAQETPSTNANGNGNGVTFVNGSSRQLTFYTRFGSDASCQALPKSQTVRIAPSQTVTVDSGGSKVCFCLQVPERRGCPTGWTEVQAGGTRRLG
jgi:hypothetical protein